MRKATVKGPIRPVYMSRVNISLPRALNFEVTPRLKPTVPDADVTSNRLSLRETQSGKAWAWYSEAPALSSR